MTLSFGFLGTNQGKIDLFIDITNQSFAPFLQPLAVLSRTMWIKQTFGQTIAKFSIYDTITENHAMTCGTPQ